jgi:putative ABC transport system substrate-binding protein
MQRREFFGIVGGAAAWPLAGNAQQLAIPVIGFLSSRTASDSSILTGAFSKGLSEFGFGDGKTVSIK